MKIVNSVCLLNQAESDDSGKLAHRRRRRYRHNIAVVTFHKYILGRIYACLDPILVEAESRFPHGVS